MDEHQIEIPASFLALYTDTRRRLSVPLPTLRDRYELCEDLAQHLTTSCRGIHVEIGVDEQEVLQRCLQGLLDGGDTVSPEEAEWVTVRLAELLDWPHPTLQGMPHKA